MPLKAISRPSRALRPSSGFRAAWAFFPWKVTTKLDMAMDFTSTVVVGEPCIISATSMSRKHPCSSMRSFPWAVSSAGVP